MNHAAAPTRGVLRAYIVAVLTGGVVCAAYSLAYGQLGDLADGGTMDFIVPIATIAAVAMTVAVRLLAPTLSWVRVLVTVLVALVSAAILIEFTLLFAFASSVPSEP